MALGEATLDVVLKEKLQQKAERLGIILRTMLNGLAQVDMLGFGMPLLLPPFFFLFSSTEISDDGLALFPPPFSLPQKHPLVGDVRGLGMMLGVELVEDKEAKTPSPAAAAYVLERARQMGVHIQVGRRSLPFSYFFFLSCSFLPASL